MSRKELEHVERQLHSGQKMASSNLAKTGNISRGFVVHGQRERPGTTQDPKFNLIGIY